MCIICGAVEVEWRRVKHRGTGESAVLDEAMVSAYLAGLGDGVAGIKEVFCKKHEAMAQARRKSLK